MVGNVVGVVEINHAAWSKGGSVVEWITRRTSNLSIASCIGLNPNMY